MRKKDQNNIIDYDKIKEIVYKEINAKEIKRKAEEDKIIELYGHNLISSNRVEKKDLMFFSSIKRLVDNRQFYVLNGNKFANHLFTRAIAKNIIFENIDFSKTYFENSYLRDCRFIRCNFEGAKFTGCNLIGSYFDDCNFDYVNFERTFVDDEIFNCAPKKDNLKYKFARSLKLNYASIGDYMKSSKAVSIELAATKSHLKDSWLSGDPYYRTKYGGLQRTVEQFWKWFKVSLLDFVWGNGESLWRLVRFNLIIFSLLTLYDIVEKSVTQISILEIIEVFLIKVPSNYFGIIIKQEGGDQNYFEYYPNWLSLFLVVTRLICFGLLMSIIIKKYNRR